MWAMGLCISRQQYDQLVGWARDVGEHECCGLMLGQGANVHELLLSDNVSPQSRTHFEIDPAILIAAEKAARAGGPAILGYFHSHPNGRAQPSATDAEMAAADGRYWLVVTDEMVTAWQAVPDGSLNERFNPVFLIVDGNAQG
jgi:desampylase